MYGVWRWVALIIVLCDTVNGNAVYFLSTSVRVDESKGTVSIDVIRTGTDGPVTVDYATRAGTATESSDFGPKTGTLSWGSESGLRPIVITILDDAMYELDETFFVVLSGVTGAGVLDPSKAEVTVIINANDRNIGTFSLGADAYNVEESAGIISIPVSRSGGSDGEVSIDYLTSPVDALEYSDFTPVSSSLTWLHGDASTHMIDISITDDDLFEGPESFVLDLVETAEYTFDIAESTITIIGPNDQAAGACQFQLSSHPESQEGNVEVVLTIVRQGPGADGDVSCDYETVSDTAGAGSDFLGKSGTVSWANGDDVPKIITISLVDDSLYEPTETFDVVLKNPQGGIALGSPSTAVVTILGPNDQNAGVVGFFNVGPTYVSEATPYTELFVSREGGADGFVSVDYTTVSRTAEAGADVQMAQGTLNWTSGDSTHRVIRVYIIDDTLYEQEEELDIQLNNPQGFGSSGGLKVNFTTHTIKIGPTNDQNIGSVEFVAATAEFAEGAGSAVVAVRRFDGSDGELSVTLRTSDRSAVAGEDFVASSEIITWGDGEDGNANFIIPLIDDDVYEGDEEFRVILESASGVTLDTLTVTILGPNDRDPGILAFSSAAARFTEDDVTITLRVTRTRNTHGAVQVDYETADKDALAGTDYTTTSGTLFWGDGDGADKEITVDILDDDLYELDEVFRVSLINPMLGAIISSTEGFKDVVIVGPNDQVAGNITLLSATRRVAESSGMLYLEIVRMGGTDGDVSVDYQTLDLTAEANFDYVPVADAVTFPSGVGGLSNAYEVPIAIINDELYEPDDESFAFQLFNIVGGATSGNIIYQVVTIAGPTDQNAGVLSLTASVYDAEESVGYVDIFVTRSAGMDGRVSVSYSTVRDGAATRDVDYIHTHGNLTWANADEATKAIRVPIVDDAIFEQDETFSLQLSASTGGATLGLITNAKIKILKNDRRPGVFHFVPERTLALERDGYAIIGVSRVDGADEAVSVTVRSREGTAVAADYTDVSTILEWEDKDNSTKFVHVFINNDDIYETSESFFLDMQDPVGATIGAGIAEVVILGPNDQVAGVLVLTGADFYFEEDVGNARVSINRVNGSDGPISVPFATTAGTATADVDFEMTNSTVTWADGQAGLSYALIPIINDTLYETLQESFRVHFGGVTGGATMPGSHDATVHILAPNDQVAGILQLSSVNISVWEGLGNISVTVERVDGVDGDISCSFETIAQTATAGLDFVPVSGNLTWANGEGGSHTIVIEVIDDDLYELPETFLLNFSNVLGGVSMPETQTDCTIAGPNDVVAGALIVLDPLMRVFENVSVVVISVNRTDGVNGPVSVHYTTVDGAAVEAEDYVNASGTLQWADGESGVKSVSITIIDDDIYEGSDESFNISFSGETGGAVVPIRDAIVTIIGPTDQVAGELEFVSTTTTVPETIGFAPVAVNRSGGTDGEVSIDYATFAGVALSPDDFLAVNGTLTWGDGEGGVKIAYIPVVNDTLWEPADEDFAIVMSNPRGGITMASPNGVVVIAGQGDLVIQDPVLVVNEGVGVVTVVLERTGANAVGEVTATYTTSGTSATPALDFIMASGVVTWADGELGAKSINITIIDDALYEALDEHLALELTSVAGPVRVNATISDIYIVGPSDQVAGVLSFASSSVAVTEEAGTILVELQRIGGQDGRVWANISTLGLTATSSLDFVPITDEVAVYWENGDTASKFLPVVVINDTLYEDANETFVVSLVAVGGGASLSNETNHTVTIVGPSDRKAGTVVAYPSFTVPVFENAEFATIGFLREGGTDGYVEVSWRTENGTAGSGEDYMSASGTFVWAHGDGSWRNVSIPIVDDDIWETGDESFLVRLVDPVGEPAIPDDTVEIVIRGPSDQRGGVLRFAQFSGSVEEDAGDVVIEVIRVDGSDGAVSVGYVVRDGTALKDIDYNDVTGRLAWPSGDVTSRFISVPIRNDGLYELSETFTVELVDELGGAIRFPDPFTVTIIGPNDAVIGELLFDPPLMYAHEEAHCGDTVVIQVSRVNGRDGAVQADIATVAGTATTNIDFTAASGTLAWADQEDGPKNFTVTIIDDSAYELPEFFRVGLSNVAGGVDVSTDHATIYIQGPNDGTPASIAFFAPLSIQVTEGASVTLTVGRSSSADGPVSVDYNAVAGTADISDFMPAAGTLSWAEGEDGPKTFEVTISNDFLSEGAETFTVVLSNVVGGAFIVASTVTITIAPSDSGPGVLGFRPGTRVATEGVDAQIIVQVERTESLVGAVSVNYLTVDDTAVAGLDYEAVSGTLTWANGDGAPQDIVIGIIDDSSYEEVDEVFSVFLSDVTGGASILAATTQVSIVSVGDKNVGRLDVSLGSRRAGREVQEGESVLVSVTRSGGADGYIGVSYVLVPGTASADDYKVTPEVLAWNNGESGSKSILINIVDDGDYEPAEDFYVELVEPVGGVVLDDGAKLRVTVAESDKRGGLVGFRAPVYWVDRASGFARIPVSRTNATDGNCSVSYNTHTRGTDAAPSLPSVDFGISAGSVLWKNRDGSDQEIVVPLLGSRNDAHGFKIELSNADGCAFLAGQSITEVRVIPGADVLAAAFLAPQVVPEPEASMHDWIVAGPVFLTFFLLLLCCLLLLAALAWHHSNQDDDDDDLDKLAPIPPVIASKRSKGVQVGKPPNAKDTPSKNTQGTPSKTSPKKNASATPSKTSPKKNGTPAREAASLATTARQSPEKAARAPAATTGPSVTATPGRPPPKRPVDADGFDEEPFVAPSAALDARREAPRRPSPSMASPVEEDTDSDEPQMPPARRGGSQSGPRFKVQYPDDVRSPPREMFKQVEAGTTDSAD